MQHRKSATWSGIGIGNGRPSGTDGSDFSYRMVVDSRYTKVAKGKSRLSGVIFFQAVIQMVEVVATFLSLSGENLDILGVSSTVINIIAIMTGELGRRRSRVNFLKFYIFASSVAMLLSISSAMRSKLFLEVVHQNSLETKTYELVKTASVVIGLLVQILAINTTTSLIQNMSPPKRAS